jgi:peroxiredoxin
MAKTPSTMLELETLAPPFSLPDTEGNTVSLEDFGEAPALVVVFMCNHCPFVIHIREALAAFGREMQERGVAMVGINANDAAAYPADAPDKMTQEKATHGYTFPYLFDETQEVAKAYRAACTPDFFLFDGDRRLVYRGQFDDSRPGSDTPVTGVDLRAAVDALLAGRNVSAEQQPSVGCNIKWRPGNEPEYFG